MTKKLLIKVTVDKALFPELYKRLDEFENPRLRASLLRSLAHDAARSAAINARNFGAVSNAEQIPPEVERLVERLPPSNTAKPVPPSDATDQNVMAALSHRFNVDEIADQFAGF